MSCTWFKISRHPWSRKAHEREAQDGKQKSQRHGWRSAKQKCTNGRVSLCWRVCPLRQVKWEKKGGVTLGVVKNSLWVDAKAHETAGGTRNADARLVAPVASEAPEEPWSSSSPNRTVLLCVLRLRTENCDVALKSRLVRCVRCKRCGSLAAFVVVVARLACAALVP